MIVYTLPAGARPYAPTVIAQATFNSDEGVFVFDEVLDLIPVNLNSIYLMDSFVISGNLTDGEYYEAVDITPTVELISKSTGNRMQHFTDPITVGRIGDQSIFTGFFYNDSTDMMQLRVKGQLNQTIPTIGKETIDLRITMTIYRVDNRDFVKEIKEVW